jgi:hypothetical protein
MVLTHSPFRSHLILSPYIYPAAERGCNEDCELDGVTRLGIYVVCCENRVMRSKVRLITRR